MELKVRISANITNYASKDEYKDNLLDNTIIVVIIIIINKTTTRTRIILLFLHINDRWYRAYDKI